MVIQYARANKNLQTFKLLPYGNYACVLNRIICTYTVNICHMISTWKCYTVEHKILAQYQTFMNLMKGKSFLNGLPN